MEEKKKTPILDDISSIEEDFSIIFKELSEYSYISDYNIIFKKLRALLIDSHQKNQNLTKEVQKLNQKIVDNARRVQTLLKMSEDDTQEIEQHKSSYERALAFVSVAQSNELKAKDLCDNMRNTIEDLKQQVALQSEKENTYDQLMADVNDYTLESKSRQEEIQSILENKELALKEVEKVNNSKNEVEDKIHHLEDVITKRDNQIQDMEKANKQYTEDIGNVKKVGEEYTQQSKQNYSDIQNKKNNNMILHKQYQSQQNIKTQYKKEHETIFAKLETKKQNRNHIHKKNAVLEDKINSINSEIERAEIELEISKEKDKTLGQLIISHQKELDEISNQENVLREEITKLVKTKQEKGKVILDLRFKNNIVKIKSDSYAREVDSKETIIHNISFHVGQAEQVTQAEKALTKAVKTCIATVKSENKKQDFSADNIEKETKDFIERTNEINIQLLRFEDNVNIIQSEITSSEKQLEYLNRCLKNCEKLSKDMRDERDKYSNKIDVVVRDNERLNELYKEKAKAVETLQRRIEQRTGDIINTHFQTRNVEKQIQSLESILDITRGLCKQATATSVGYRLEYQKLCTILEEANKDIKSAKAEIFTIRNMTNLIRQQLYNKSQSTEKETQNALTLYHELLTKQEAAKEQAKDTYELSNRLEQLIAQHVQLKRRAGYHAKLEIALIQLNGQLKNEKELAHACISEFSHPYNVHRWRLMKEIHPEQYKNIQLIEFLKTKIEAAKREYMKLNKQKEGLFKKIQKNKTTIKGCKINDGENAMRVYKNAIAKKEKELEEMKKEIDQCIKEREEIINTISLIREKIKHSHIVTTNLRKQNQQFYPIPNLKLYTVITGLDKTRLGGGFNIAPERPKTPEMQAQSHKNQVSRFFLTESQTDKTEPISAQETPPPSNKARPSSAISFASKNPKNNISSIYNNTYYNSGKQMKEFTPRIKKERKRNELDQPGKKKPMKTGKVTIKRQEEQRTPRVEFHNSQLSARRAKNNDSKPSSSLSKPMKKIADNNKSNWRPQSVIKPACGPFFGPI